MKKLLILFTMIFFISCSKETIYMNTAQITGYDYRLCMCCGGYFIELDNSERYRLISLPDNFKVNDNFPISVKINWEKNTSYCNDGRDVIDIIDIELIE